MGHSRWELLKKQSKSPEHDKWTRESYKHLIAFHRGYILALEDAARDVGWLRLNYQYGYSPDALLSLQDAVAKIQETLKTSEESLARLLEREENHGTDN
jgi:hypothetical protein